MQSFLKTSSVLAVLSLVFVQNSRCQSIRLIGADALNGAITGLTLGGATMALQNMGLNNPDNRGPLRVGLGGGILYGIGIGVYDNSMISGSEQFYISGTFNDGKNSTILVFLDTVYGAAGGAAIGAAISLIANDPILDGLQYGAGGGAWIGFGFGLIDAFMLAQNPNDLQASVSSNSSLKANGIVQIDPPASANVSIGLLNPTVISQKVINAHSLKIDYSIGMELINVKVGL